MPLRKDDEIGKLVLLERLVGDKSYKVQWRCLCACGNETITWASSLSQNKVGSCGCAKESRKRIIKEGERYHRLVALRPAPRLNGRLAWYCQCDCGKITHIQVSSLGWTKSCGCEAACIVRYKGDLYELRDLARKLRMSYGTLRDWVKFKREGLRSSERSKHVLQHIELLDSRRGLG